MAGDDPRGPVPGDDQNRQPQAPPGAGQIPPSQAAYPQPSYAAPPPSRQPGAGWWIGAALVAVVLGVGGYLVGHNVGQSNERDNFDAGAPGYNDIYQQGFAAGKDQGTQQGQAQGAAQGEQAGARAGQQGQRGRRAGHERRSDPGARRLHDVGARGPVRHQGQGRLGLGALPDLEPHPDAARHRLCAVPRRPVAGVHGRGARGHRHAIGSRRNARWSTPFAGTVRRMAPARRARGHRGRGKGRARRRSLKEANPPDRADAGAARASPTTPTHSPCASRGTDSRSARPSAKRSATVFGRSNTPRRRFLSLPFLCHFWLLAVPFTSFPTSSTSGEVRRHANAAASTAAEGLMSGRRIMRNASKRPRRAARIGTSSAT